MTITVGQKLYYAGKGPYLVAERVSKMVCGASSSFYRFIPLDDSGEEFLVPVANAALLPLRALTAVNKIPELLRRLKSRAGPPRSHPAHWREREAIRVKIFASGSAFELGDFIEGTMRSCGIRKLAADEWEALRRARRLLTAEIAAVMGESFNAAAARIDDVLGAAPDSAVKHGSSMRFYRRVEKRG